MTIHIKTYTSISHRSTLNPLTGKVFDEHKDRFMEPKNHGGVKASLSGRNPQKSYCR